MNPLLCTSISIFGAACAAFGHVGAANLAWSISNPFLIWHNWKAGEIHQARMFGIFGFLAIFGVIREVLL